MTFTWLKGLWSAGQRIGGLEAQRESTFLQVQSNMKKLGRAARMYKMTVLRVRSYSFC